MVKFNWKSTLFYPSDCVCAIDQQNSTLPQKTASAWSENKHKILTILLNALELCTSTPEISPCIAKQNWLYALVTVLFKCNSHSKHISKYTLRCAWIEPIFRRLFFIAKCVQSKLNLYDISRIFAYNYLKIKWKWSSFVRMCSIHWRSRHRNSQYEISSFCVSCLCCGNFVFLSLFLSLNSPVISIFISPPGAEKVYFYFLKTCYNFPMNIANLSTECLFYLLLPLLFCDVSKIKWRKNSRKHFTTCANFRFNLIK